MPWYSQLGFLYTFFSWRDALEIFMLAACIYYFSCWLRNDRQKNLLLYFYGLCTLVLGTHYLELSTFNTFFLLASPILVIFFIVVHQETLQKNYIMLRNVTPIKETNSEDWLELLVSTCLMAVNNNKTIHCVIEHKDNLESLITTPMSLYADVQKNLLSMLLESDTLDQTRMIWITSTGRLRGINASWTPYAQDWLADSVKNFDSWQQDALFFSVKTDAIVFKITPETRSFSIIAQGKSFTGISAAHTLKTIKKYLTLDQKGDLRYAHHIKKESFEQRDA